MSPKKGQSTAAAKRKREVADYEGGRSGRWTMRIEPNEAAFIAQNLTPCHLVIQNHGPGLIKLVAQNGDLMDLSSGKLRATYVHGSLTVEVRGDKPALIELEFLPVFLKR